MATTRYIYHPGTKTVLNPRECTIVEIDDADVEAWEEYQLPSSVSSVLDFSDMDYTVGNVPSDWFETDREVIERII